MKRVLATALLAGLLANPAFAALKPGDAAPAFTAPATLAGKEFTFSLADKLKDGPVVLYFYPAAFTSGCSVEAHDFAESTDRFKALGAAVIGVSADKLDVLDKFSTADCQSKFALAADPELKVAKSYDAVLTQMLGYADRTSYVITPDGKILYSYSAMDPDKHVENTMAALEKWRAGHKG
ncbi:MAG: Alkyl hydroperoxide reductase subunit C-like protein [Rhodospirillales bacterium]|nr:Alkyl hydroperoxide reductase subunit C-like protein [Rhodospirillales bacterium]